MKTHYAARFRRLATLVCPVSTDDKWTVCLIADGLEVMAPLPRERRAAATSGART